MKTKKRNKTKKNFWDSKTFQKVIVWIIVVVLLLSTGISTLFVGL